MIITRVPLRVSFLGGGTDYPDYFNVHRGQTLAVTINKYSYLTVNRLTDLFDYSIRVSYSKLELVDDRDQIQHPSVRECLRFMDIGGGIEIHYVGDLPARTGLGSSSSFTVALLHALHALKGEVVSRTQLAEEAVHVEQDLIGERVGSQDQYACAHGGLMRLTFDSSGVGVDPIPLRRERLADLNAHLMLMYTGIRRDAHEVLAEQIDRTRRGTISDDLRIMGGLVDEGLAAIASDAPITAFGEVLHTGWTTKRRLSTRISSTDIDSYYERARGAGAVGGKLLGAGAGGFMLLVAEPGRQQAVADAVPELRRVPFSFESSGSTILFYDGKRA